MTNGFARIGLLRMDIARYWIRQQWPRQARDSKRKKGEGALHESRTLAKHGYCTWWFEREEVVEQAVLRGVDKSWLKLFDNRGINVWDWLMWSVILSPNNKVGKCQMGKNSKSVLTEAALVLESKNKGEYDMGRRPRMARTFYIGTGKVPPTGLRESNPRRANALKKRYAHGTIQLTGVAQKKFERKSRWVLQISPPFRGRKCAEHLGKSIDLCGCLRAHIATPSKKKFSGFITWVLRESNHRKPYFKSRDRTYERHRWPTDPFLCSVLRGINIENKPLVRLFSTLNRTKRIFSTWSSPSGKAREKRTERQAFMSPEGIEPSPSAEVNGARIDGMVRVNEREKKSRDSNLHNMPSQEARIPQKNNLELDTKALNTSHRPALHPVAEHQTSSSALRAAPKHQQPIPVLAPADVQHAISLIHAAYDPSAATDLPQLQYQSLQSALLAMQRTAAAWGLIVPLLAHEDTDVQFFGAHTVHAKIARGDLGGLPPQGHLALRDVARTRVARREFYRWHSQRKYLNPAACPTTYRPGFEITAVAPQTRALSGRGSCPMHDFSPPASLFLVLGDLTSSFWQQCCRPGGPPARRAIRAMGWTHTDTFFHPRPREMAMLRNSHDIVQTDALAPLIAEPAPARRGTDVKYGSPLPIPLVSPSFIAALPHFSTIHATSVFVPCTRRSTSITQPAALAPMTTGLCADAAPRADKGTGRRRWTRARKSDRHSAGREWKEGRKGTRYLPLYFPRHAPRCRWRVNKEIGFPFWTPIPGILDFIGKGEGEGERRAGVDVPSYRRPPPYARRITFFLPCRRTLCISQRRRHLCKELAGTGYQTARSRSPPLPSLIDLSYARAPRRWTQPQRKNAADLEVLVRRTEARSMRAAAGRAEAEAERTAALQRPCGILERRCGYRIAHRLAVMLLSLCLRRLHPHTEIKRARGCGCEPKGLFGT
ncbi:hypothetical protein DFH06DRAFT_1417150 [Mycena polygramma]|nr:hypothetical protein DFH06DRAFT_1417150 [Mycena polygramma]